MAKGSLDRILAIGRETEREPHWIACAPVGVPSSGPSVVATEGAANEYREMGWGVSGPYVLASEVERGAS